MPELLPLHPVVRLHLDHLTSDLGIAQHAIGAEPDPTHGTCVDDVARALLVDLLHARELGWDVIGPSVARNVAYLADAFDATEGRFHNLRAADGTWRDTLGSEDANARALQGLGETVAAAPAGALRDAASELFLRALPTASVVSGLRPMAAVLLGCDAADRSGLGGSVPAIYQRVGNDLRLAFESRMVTFDWPWPEETLRSENELPARALIIGGQRLGYQRMARTGFRVLDWLIDAQRAEAGHLSTIGDTGWWPRGGQKARFDQRPVSATSLLLAADAAFTATGTPRYREAMEMAYGWFLGRNDAGLPVVDVTTGAGHDGIGPDGVSENRSGGSTIMWLLALEHIRARRGAGTASPVAAGALRATA